MKIKTLSNSTINRIAAGEVVERPASAVKELVENAIDASANRVDIVIENGGRNLISIIDDGIGMSKEDLHLAVERHTTSKLPEEDINNIEFFGFRGEALPSICSIGRVTITSCLKNQEHGWSLYIEGGNKLDTTPSSSRYGTSIELRDLFFATPARLKFLKTEKTETQHIIEIISKIAMANPHIAFTLTADKKRILDLKSYHDDQSLFNRLNDLAGKLFADNFIEVDLQDQDCLVKGYVSVPTYNQGTSNEQYFFINKRPVRDKTLAAAVKIAYHDFVPQGRYPAVYLFLEMDSAFVDVNVHPAKAEVRFKDTNFIRGAVISAIKTAIRNIGHKASTHIQASALNSFIPEYKITINNDDQPKSITQETKYSYSPAKKYFSPAAQINEQLFAPIMPIVKAENPVAVELIEDFPLGAACGQIHDTYIIAQTKEGMILIDQHAAHERIFYERLKTQILQAKIQTQRLLIPEIIELPEHILEQLLAKKDDLVKLGLYFDQFGSTAIAVTELPALLKCADVRNLVMDIVDDLQEFEQEVSLENKMHHILASFACHHSIRAGRSLTIAEMNGLLREIEQNIHTGQCNHGRPTYIKLNLKDIERLFERT